jgi:hypothetical protein
MLLALLRDWLAPQWQDQENRLRLWDPLSCKNHHQGRSAFYDLVNLETIVSGLFLVSLVHSFVYLFIHSFGGHQVVSCACDSNWKQSVPSSLCGRYKDLESPFVSCRNIKIKLMTLGFRHQWQELQNYWVRKTQYLLVSMISQHQMLVLLTALTLCG